MPPGRDNPHPLSTITAAFHLAFILSRAGNGIHVLAGVPQAEGRPQHRTRSKSGRSVPLPAFVTPPDEYSNEGADPHMLIASC